MIKHIVFWQLKDEALGNTKARNMELVKEKLMACADIVPGIVDFEVGLGGSGLECTYDVVLYSTFEDKSALDAYQVHPQHEAIKSFIGEVRSARQCMDYEVI
ncbi:stress responsive alpha/beta barrel protein [Limnobacter thiooxidans]|uniref:Dabb family protein n=1 Tax=Limnobacter thiooxidans TaxID=131080 RepID=A0AA86MIB6_9BURK|nr:stress responsive alpha/beta barrel protein [Limnobacter thiooxidans]BET26052.1 Dabb family protein [Limnobacter thiooxidans]